MFVADIASFSATMFCFGHMCCSICSVSFATLVRRNFFAKTHPLFWLANSRKMSPQFQMLHTCHCIMYVSNIIYISSAMFLKRTVCYCTAVQPLLCGLWNHIIIKVDLDRPCWDDRVGQPLFQGVQGSLLVLGIQQLLLHARTESLEVFRKGGLVLFISPMYMEYFHIQSRLLPQL